MKNSSRREFLQKLALSSLAVAASPALINGFVSNKSKPNIIYILADDLGYGDVGCYGQKKIKTPNIDKLAQDGIKFNQHYSGCTVCAPSRCSLITGKHTGHATVRGNEEVLLKNDEVTIGKELKKLGYSTACIGKWGVGHPPPPGDPKKNGFDYFFGYLNMWHAHNSYTDFLWRNDQKVFLQNVVKHPTSHSQNGQEQLTGVAEKKIEFTQDLFTSEALSFIEKQKNPFFLYLTYTLPHANNEAGDFNEIGIEVPDLGIYKNENWPEAEKAKAAAITLLDSYVGKVVAKVKELGIEKNTLIIFASDNGPHKEGGVNPDFFESNKPFKGNKRDLYDGGIRVPMIAKWTGTIQPRSTTSLISAFWDVMPTLVETAGGKVDFETDGISFLPTLLGKNNNQKEHEYLYWEFHEGNTSQAIRMGNWKAVRLAPTKPIELYDITNDLHEDNNVADKHPDIINKVETILKHVRNNEERWPLKNKS